VDHQTVVGQRDERQRLQPGEVGSIASLPRPSMAASTEIRRAAEDGGGRQGAARLGVVDVVQKPCGQGGHD
jgi:hypothetical protein